MYLDSMAKEVAKDSANLVNSEEAVRMDKAAGMPKIDAELIADNIRQMEGTKKALAMNSLVLDSLKKSYAGANGMFFYGWKVNATIYYQKHGGAKTFYGHFLVTKNDSVISLDPGRL